MLAARTGSVGTIRFGASTLLTEIIERNSLLTPRPRNAPVRPVLTEIADAERVRDLIATAQAALNT